MSFRLLRWRSPCSARSDETHHYPQVASILSSFSPPWLPASRLIPVAENQVARNTTEGLQKPNRSQARAAVNASQAFSWPNWIEADDCLFLAWGLTEGKALVFLYGAAKHLCVRWLVVKKLLLPGSWLEMETHSLKFSKDIKKPCEAVPFTESRGPHPARPQPFLLAAAASLAACCQLVTPVSDPHLDLVATSCYCCGVDKCISYLQLLCSGETPLHHRYVNQRCLHGQQGHTVLHQRHESQKLILLSHQGEAQ